MDSTERNGSRVAVEHGDAVQEERGGESTEQEVLDRRLLTQQPPPSGEAAHEIERQRQDLEGDKEHQQIVRRGEQHHAGDGKHEQRKHFGLRTAGGDARPFLRRAGHGGGLSDQRSAAGLRRAIGEQQHARDGDDGDRALDEQRRAIDGDSAGRRDLSMVSQRAHCDERSDQTCERHRDLRRPPLGAGREGVDEDADDGRDRYDEDRRQRRVGDRGRGEVGCESAQGVAPVLLIWLTPVKPACGGCDGTGSCERTLVNDECTAGLMTSSSGFG